MRFEDIAEYVCIKLEAFKKFTTQIKEFPHLRSLESIENLSKMRGATVGFTSAECFMVIRQIAE